MFPPPATKPMNKALEIVTSTRTFLHEVQVELKKCNWPERPELMEQTGVVLTAVGIIALAVAVSDAIIQGVMKVVIR
jgi:preprotein translocase SecE subunit